MSDFIKEGHRDELFIVGKVWNDAHRPQLARCADMTDDSKLRTPIQTHMHMHMKASACHAI